MQRALPAWSAISVSVVGAGLIAAPPSTSAGPEPHSAAVRLADSPIFALGDGPALIVGPSFLATPGIGYQKVYSDLYLAPFGFTGDTQAVTTPEQLYPFTGPFSGTLDTSLAQGAQNVYAAIMQQLDTEQVTADNPLVVGGYSQSTIIEAMVQRQLADAGVSSDLVHFVMLGDVSTPNGGLLERFNIPDGAQPTAPSLGITFTAGQESDLYPTEVYNHEYDGFADFPQYPINFLADLNALLGIAFEHTTYLGLTPKQISDAVLLPTATDGLTSYHMVRADGLPLLDPLLFFGAGGKAVYDLLAPAMTILVNLGYGNLDHGWSDGPADVNTPLAFLPDSATLDALMKQLPQALDNAMQQGVSDFLHDIEHPTNPAPAFLTELTTMLSGDMATGNQLAQLFSTFPTTEDLFGTFPPHTGLPALDVATALLFTIPQIDYNIIAAGIADGDVIDAIGTAIAADLGILPLALVGAVF